MPNTMTLISSVTVGAAGASSIDFTSIPSTYTDLVFKFSIRNTADVVDMTITFNGSSANLSDRVLYGSGSAASSFADAATMYSLGNRSSFLASTFGNGELYIPNYAGSTNKSVSQDVVTENNATSAAMYLTAGLRSNTAAITQITIAPTSGNIAQYSTAYLYGVKNA